MALMAQLQELSRLLGDSVEISPGPSIEIRDQKALSQSIEILVRQAVFSPEPAKSHAQWLIRALASQAGAYPASIHEFYLARGRGETPDDFTVPAMNLRALPFHAARAVFRSAISGDACAFIFEIARSEMGYTISGPYSVQLFQAMLAPLSSKSPAQKWATQISGRLSMLRASLAQRSPRGMAGRSSSREITSR